MHPSYQRKRGSSKRHAADDNEIQQCRASRQRGSAIAVLYSGRVQYLSSVGEIEGNQFGVLFSISLLLSEGRVGLVYMTPMGSASAMARLYSHSTLMLNDHEPKIDQQRRVMGLGPVLILTAVSASRNQPKWNPSGNTTAARRQPLAPSRSRDNSHTRMTTLGG